MILGLLALIAISPGLQEPPFPAEPIRLANLVDLDGKARQVPDPENSATVVLFVTVDCPISNRYVPEIKRIADEYAKKKVLVLLAYVDPYLDTEDVTLHRKEFEISIPAVIDTKHLVVKALGATVTPEAVVLDSHGKLKYRGRIDDTYVEHGRPRDKPTRRDLRIALDEVLAGKAVSEPVTRSIGCDIPIGT